jgi:hypothetical protein
MAGPVDRGDYCVGRLCTALENAASEFPNRSLTPVVKISGLVSRGANRSPSTANMLLHPIASHPIRPEGSMLRPNKYRRGINSEKQSDRRFFRSTPSTTMLPPLLMTSTSLARRGISRNAFSSSGPGGRPYFDFPLQHVAFLFIEGVWDKSFARPTFPSLTGIIAKGHPVRLRGRILVALNRDRREQTDQGAAQEE